MDRDTKAKLIKAVCALTSDSLTLDIAKRWEMSPGGRAAAHLDHYLQGSGKDLAVDLAKVLAEDEGVRFKVNADVIFGLRAGKTTGTVAIPQSVYKNKDWQFAIGSMNVNWEFPSRSAPDRVRIGFRNQYRWHPNEARITQCIHQAAERLKLRGASDYWMEGKADILPSIAEWARPSPRFYYTKAGDTLSQIAAKFYGRAERWPEIHAANRIRVADPDRLAIGIVIEVP